MIKSIKVTATKSSNSDIWPLYEMLDSYTGYTVYDNVTSSLLQADITEYIASNAFELITQDSKQCYRWIGVPNLNNLFPGEELIVIPPASGEDLQKPIPLGQSIGLSVLLFILAILLSFLSTFLFSGN